MHIDPEKLKSERLHVDPDAPETGYDHAGVDDDGRSDASGKVLDPSVNQNGAPQIPNAGE